MSIDQNLLREAKLVKQMADSIPTHSKDDSSSAVSSMFESIALFTHAAMINVGFRLVGLAEDEENESMIAASAPRLPSQWLAPFNHYQFIYRHTQSALLFKIKVTKEASKAVITGIAMGEGERLSKGEFEVTAKEYIFNGALPIRISVTEDGTEDRSGLEEKLRTVFISTARIEDLASLFKINIIQKLLPKLQKEGYEETGTTETSSSQSAAARNTRDDLREEREQGGPNHGWRPLIDPTVPRPSNSPLPGPDGFIPGFDDELDLNRRPHYPQPNLGPFGGIGRDDLYPAGLGPHDPLRPSFGPSPGGNGGMHPTFNDPMFHGDRPGPYDPRAPPGARYDPVGPGGPGNPFGTSGPGNPFGGRGPNGFGGNGDPYI